MADDNEKEQAKPEHGLDLLNNVSDAPTIYADGCIFVSTIGNAIRISFVETIVEPANGPNPGLKTRHVANIVMPVEGFSNTLDYMNQVSKSWADAREALTGTELEKPDVPDAS